VPYLGNDLQVAQPSYRNIDDISGSFNSSTTSFPLLVSGAAPVPFPINSNQCLISVAGVVQRPDDSGTEGFRISGGNIIFSSAPSTGADFFGVILAGADYVNVGANFPSGSAAVPSITFDSDLDTGIYNSAANQVSITTAGTERLRIDSAGQIEAVSLGTAAAPSFSFTTDPNTGIYSPGADQVAISTNGTGRLFIDSSGRVLVGTSSARNNIFNASYSALFQVETDTTVTSQALLTSATAGFQGARLTLAHQRSGGIGGNTILQSGDETGFLSFQGSDGSEFVESASIKGEVDGTPGANDMPGRLVFLTASDGSATPTERVRITSTGAVGIGTTSVSGGQVVINSTLDASNKQLVLRDATNGWARKIGVDSSNNMGFYDGDTERMRIDSSGRLLVGTSTATANGGVLELSGGITFPATAVAASNANTLDDYEEGTFTPTVIGTSTPGTGTYVGQTGIYVKIGRRVIFDIYVDWTAHTGTGSINVSGLPFVSAPITGLYLLTAAAGFLSTGASTVLGAYVTQNTANIALFTMPVGGGASGSVSMDTSATLYLSGSYNV
jgi:hypothetical protein